MQLTELQMERLREAAERERLSISELIRRAIDDALARSFSVPREDMKRRAIEIAGQFASGHANVSSEHDRFLDEAFGS